MTFRKSPPQAMTARHRALALARQMPLDNVRNACKIVRKAV
jgi:hypothetical protein